VASRLDRTLERVVADGWIWSAALLAFILSALVLHLLTAAFLIAMPLIALSYFIFFGVRAYRIYKSEVAGTPEQ